MIGKVKKVGLISLVVEAKGSSSYCSFYNTKLIKAGYRKLKCPKCRFEVDRDTVARLVIYKRAFMQLSKKMWKALTLMNAFQMKNVVPNRRTTKDRRSLYDREEVRFMASPKLALSSNKELTFILMHGVNIHL